MKMTGNTIFITGGGSGIGRGLAEAFHQLKGGKSFGKYRQGRYSSDMSDAEFALIAPLLPPPKRRGRKPTSTVQNRFYALILSLPKEAR